MPRTAGDRRPAADDVVERILAQNAAVAGDILEISASTWVIHGAIAVDGDVILAEFTSARAAHETLALLASFEP